jgi:citrate synthase
MEVYVCSEIPCLPAKCPLWCWAVQVPTSAQVQDVSAELARRATLPKHVKAVLEALPVETHPMTQFITAITALQVRTHSSCAQELLLRDKHCLCTVLALQGLSVGPKRALCAWGCVCSVCALRT